MLDNSVPVQSHVNQINGILLYFEHELFKKLNCMLHKDFKGKNKQYVLNLNIYQL